VRFITCLLERRLFEKTDWENDYRQVMVTLQAVFSWGRGYGAFSVSQSHVDQVAAYIANQETHHRKKPFGEEFEVFVKKYGLEWRDEVNR
jgi:hypothetical protein